MKSKVYYNTLIMCFTDGRKVWTDKDSSAGHVPQGRSCIRYKVNGKLYSRKQVLNARYLVRVMEIKLPF
ncbi:hypothetical protein UFOVP402_36 [uncultured Caudovirales phage]|uniref:Uncharacterized protein n=1 Tax=uncultured Caudovirales phage TaxID=2100421 RepID=A0A6J5M5T5_9CAUD|nr:hypothetical protein UFOVP402_36 [uncultured Caudovirales phage]